MDKIVRCYAQGSAEGWEAICLDFDVATQADTLDEVIRELREAIDVYIETVDELPAADRARLFGRPAPFALRAKRWF